MYLFSPSFTIYISQFLMKKQEFVGKKYKGKYCWFFFKMFTKILEL